MKKKLFTAASALAAVILAAIPAQSQAFFGFFGGGFSFGVGGGGYWGGPGWGGPYGYGPGYWRHRHWIHPYHRRFYRRWHHPYLAPILGLPALRLSVFPPSSGDGHSACGYG